MWICEDNNFFFCRFIESITVIAFGTVLHYSGLMNFLGSVFGAHTRVLTKQKFSVDLMIHMITRFSVSDKHTGSDLRACRICL